MTGRGFLPFRRAAIVVAIAVATGAGPSLAAPKTQELTPLQLQAMQQREYEVEKRVAFSSVMDVLQDLGFTISSADLTTGFITGESPTTKTKSASDFWLYGGATSNMRVTGFVEEMASGKTKIRLNFVSRKTRANVWTYQQENHDNAMIDPKLYAAAFEKIDEAMFVRKAVNSQPK